MLKATKLGVLATVVASLPLASVQANVLPVTPQTGIVENGFFYWSLGGQGQWMQLPKFNWSLTPSGTSDALFDKRVNVAGGGVSATMGRVLDGINFGHRPRLELALSTFHGSGSTSGSFSRPAFDTSYVGVGGGGTVFFPTCCFAADWDVRLKVRTDTGDGALRFKTDFRVTPRLVLTPRLGIMGGATFTSYKLSADQNSTAGLFNHRLKETLNTWRLGGEGGLDATFRLTPRWLLHLGGGVAVYHQRSRLTGNDCFGNAVGPNCPQLGPGEESSVANNSSRIGLRLNGALGATYDFGWAYITAMFTGQWQVNTPGVRNPTALDLGSARVDYENTWSFGGFVVLSFPIYP